MKTLDLYLNEQLKNEEFRKEWEENQPEMDNPEGAGRTHRHQSGGYQQAGKWNTQPIFEAAEASGRRNGNGPEACVYAQRTAESETCKIRKMPGRFPMQETGPAFLHPRFSLSIICFGAGVK